MFLQGLLGKLAVPLSFSPAPTLAIFTCPETNTLALLADYFGVKLQVS